MFRFVVIKATDNLFFCMDIHTKHYTDTLEIENAGDIRTKSNCLIIQKQHGFISIAPSVVPSV